jgi:hypothetical protein
LCTCQAIPLAVAKEYDANAIGHLNTLKAVIERLGKYFSDKCKENLDKITKAKLELTAPEKSFLSGLKNDIDALVAMLEGLRTVSFFSLRDVDEISDKSKIDQNCSFDRRMPNLLTSRS